MAEVEDREGLSILEEQIPYFFNNIEEKYKYARKHCEDHYTERKLLFARLLNDDFPTDNDPVIEDNEPVDDNLKKTRKRKASRLASLKIKRNINIPLKLRRSRRTGNVFDRSLKVNDESKKGNCSKDRNLSDSEWETEQDEKAVTPPQPVQRNTPVSLVKMRAMQFEKLVANGNLEEKENLKNSTYVQKKAKKTEIINPAAGSSKQIFNSPKQKSKGTGVEKTEPALSNSCSVHPSTSSTKSGRNTTKETNAKNKSTTAKKTQSKTTESKSKKEAEVGTTNAERLRKQHEDRHKKVIAAREAAYAKRQLAEKEYLQKKEERMKAKAAEKERLQKEEESGKAAVALQKNLQKKLAQKNNTQKQLKGKDCGDTSAAAVATASGTTLATLEVPTSKVAKVLLTKLEKNQNATYCKVPDADSSNVTPDRSTRPPANENNYGLDDAAPSDSSEDEDHPRKKIPEWAMRQNREVNDMITAFIPLKVPSTYFKCNKNPDIEKLMGVPSCASKRQRTSSAIWTTPPVKHL